MKTTFVKDFVADQTVTSFFLVHEKEIRNSAAGKAYLRMELGDRSGTVESRMWDQFETCAKEVHRDDFVKVQGRVELYRNRFQLILQQFRLAKPEEIELGDYLPHTPYNVDDLFQQKAEALAAWAGHLRTIVEPSRNVVRLAKARA